MGMSKNSFAARLRQTVSEEASRLRAIPENDAGRRAGGGQGWSVKQELGHLVDSATNNRVRFVVAALEGRYLGPTYDGQGWVNLGGYSEMRWPELVQIWEQLNHALAYVIERIPDERLSASCSVGGNNRVSFEFLIDDYLRHMQHHLDQHYGPRSPTVTILR